MNEENIHEEEVKENGDLPTSAEDQAIQDAYWHRRNENPYQPGSPDWNRYEEAFTAEIERLEIRDTEG